MIGSQSVPKSKSLLATEMDTERPRKTHGEHGERHEKCGLSIPCFAGLVAEGELAEVDLEATEQIGHLPGG